jgi:hypothetical protein
MPVPMFLGIVGLVIAAAAATIALAFWLHVPLVALGFAALAGSLIMTWQRLMR